jgi:hypothetical protein
MVAFHLAATLAAGLSLALHADQFAFPTIFLSVLKAVFVSLALLTLISLRRTHAQETWLKERLSAEYCRSILATWHCRDTIEPVSFQEVPELRELARSALFLRLDKSRTDSVDFKAFRSAYAHDRVLGQLKYFQGEGDRAVAKAGPIRTRYWIYTLAAVAFSLLLLGLRFWSKAFSSDAVAASPYSIKIVTIILDVLPLALPALASFTLARLAIEDVDRRIGRFRDLQNKMRLTLIDLSYCTSWESLCRSVERTERILFNEVLEWYSIARYSSAM